jgi:hypothetical protein
MYFDTQRKLIYISLFENQSCPTSRDTTRAGFKTPTVFAPLKLFSSLIMKDPSLSTVRYGNTNQTGLLLSI